MNNHNNTTFIMEKKNSSFEYLKKVNNINISKMDSYRSSNRNSYDDSSDSSNSKLRFHIPIAGKFIGCTMELLIILMLMK